MHILQNKDECVGCGSCANICPKKCIAMRRNEEGFLEPFIDNEECIKCKKCQRACPILNACKETKGETQAFATYSVDDNIRYYSTSGGIFTLLSSWIIQHNGVVYGAIYDENFKVVHKRCESIEQIGELRQAKYSQSDLENCFIEIKKILEIKQYVLFSGTPCQIAALKSFLGKNYLHLYLVDLICHGVPSPAVWGKYVEYRSGVDNEGNLPLNINMRCKETGWPSYSVCFKYQEGNKYIEKNNLDPYMRAFINDLCLRKSCYNCKFKGINRMSDFTLGDYWGIWSQMPEFNDGKGTSIVLIHSSKAMEIWNHIKKETQYRELPVKLSVSENPAAEHSAKMTEQREVFLKRYQEEDFQYLVNLLIPLESKKNLSENLILKEIKKLVKGINKFL